MDVPERAVPGSWPADVYAIAPPTDPEGSTDFIYSVVEGDVNHVFGIGGSFAMGSTPDGNTDVLVVRPPGPLTSIGFYNLSIGATDDSEPPATGILLLYVTVQATRVELPSFNFTCYHDNPCTVSSGCSTLTRCVLPAVCSHDRHCRGCVKVVRLEGGGGLCCLQSGVGFRQ